MPEENKESVDNQANNSTGSSDNNGPANSNPNMLDDGAGEPGQLPSKNNEETVPKEQFSNLEKKIGEQGVELGESREKVKEYEQYFDDISPLMESLSKDKELISYITSGKISSQLVKEVLEGKVPAKEATEVTKAHSEVKNEMGKDEYNKASTEDIEKRIEEKLKGLDDKFQKIEKDFEGKLADSEKLHEYEKKVEDFASSTPDLKDYLPRIGELMEEHPEITRIDILYKLAKAEVMEKKSEEDAEKKKTEDEKNLAANLIGGSSYGRIEVNDPDVANELIGGSSNPNII